MRMISARADALSACGRTGAGAALALAERYLRREPRTQLRLHTLAALLAFVKRDRLIYGSELVERVGVPVLGACAADADCLVRAAAARALADLARVTQADCTDLIDLLEKVQRCATPPAPSGRNGVVTLTMTDRLSPLRS